MPNVVCITGSVVSGCYISRFVGHCADQLREAGCEVEEVLAWDFDLPVFTFPLERDSGMPEAARRAHEIFSAADGLIVGSPEINGSTTGVLKNLLDWASRPIDDEEQIGEAFLGLPTAVISASKHLHAGLRGADHLKHILSSLGCVLLPEQAAVPFAQLHFAGAEDAVLSDLRTYEEPQVITDQAVIKNLDQICASVFAAASAGRSAASGRPAWLDNMIPTEGTA